MIDLNEIFTKDNEISSLLIECELHDHHANNPPPSTYIGSATRRIDYMFGTLDILQATDKSGALSYVEGPQSDHRGLFVDLNTMKLFGEDAHNLKIAPSQTRLLQSGNPDSVERCTNLILRYYAHHNMFARMEQIYIMHETVPTEVLRDCLERWHNNQGRAMKAAESLLSRPHQKHSWSPKLRNAGITRRHWKLRQQSERTNINIHRIFDRMESQVRQHDSNFQLPRRYDTMSKEEVSHELTVATKNLREIQHKSTPYRFHSYHDLLAEYESDTNPATSPISQQTANIISRTIASEQIRSTFRNIRETLNCPDSGPLNKILVPCHKEADAPPTNFQQFLATANPDDILWGTVTDSESVETTLLRFNCQSFGAASTSPCGHGVIYDALAFSSLFPDAKSLLNDRSIPEAWKCNNPIIRIVLLECAIPTHIQNMAPIPNDITEADISYGFKKWKEQTSTSPCGRHFGHYKAMIQHPRLLRCWTLFLHVTKTKGIAIARWQKAVNIMIEKDNEDPKLHQLRIIHLFEADFNLCLKLQWGSRLVRQSLQQDLFHHTGQHGSVPGQSTIDPIMLMQLSTDMSRILKTNMTRFDNDASACYNRILGMLAARQCGMPDEAINTHATSLEHMQYSVKTACRISTYFYTGSISSPLFGTVNGSRHHHPSGYLWLSL